MLQQIAERGNGVYQEFRNKDIQNLGLGALDYSSLASRERDEDADRPARSAACPTATAAAVDSDGDGLPDTMDNSPSSTATNQFFADSDGDCFDDHFEVLHADVGFAPDKKDIRGCDPASPLTPELHLPRHRR